MKINQKIADYIKRRTKEGKNVFILQGGRRSGKTWSIMQYLLLRSYNKTKITNIATQTAEQARLGSFSDALNIMKSEPLLSSVYEFTSNPREIRNKINGSRLFFNSYRDSNRAKGIASDFLFINEANTFSREQYIDLSVNAREAIFLDYNPNANFWIEDYFGDDEILKTSWKDNPFLTDLQKEYFYKLKERAESPNATEVDIYNYRVQYLGEYYGITGTIFTQYNLKVIDKLPNDTFSYMIFLDPSALRGADYFSCVLSCRDRNENYYIVDVYSVNQGTREEIANKIMEWCSNYDVKRVYCESNGIINISFIEFILKNYKMINIQSWYSSSNKYDRILANYEPVVYHTFFLDNPRLNEFLQQIYNFSSKCEHDDHIDSVVNSILAQNFK